MCEEMLLQVSRIVYSSLFILACSSAINNSQRCLSGMLSGCYLACCEARRSCYTPV